ncbi:DNA (cytosine-5-)-methyltransferase [Deinococcus misasensis]|uniref:DNA (cytosine-5-)-methyltransferase n=1 Tax=Deinococcus misasensis TaxID=392413 RepID=UPI0009FF2F50|nr:DNA (cytosine-5-)-methyltransferase [Deinococcus misasensis]
MPRKKSIDTLQSRAHEILLDTLKYTSKEVLSQALGTTVRTLTRWEAADPLPPGHILLALQQFRDTKPDLLPACPVQQVEGCVEGEFTFIDLFAGIGGIRQGFERNGGRCVFTSEWNEFSQKTYQANFPADHELAGDITPYPKEHIPDHDVLLAGFPCQPFSIAGVSKKNSLGRAHGFECDTQGTLFFEIEKTIEVKRPMAFMLENVKNLTSHDKGRTFATIKATLEDKLGYHIHYRVIDGKHFTPQHRERIIIVGFREPVDFSWEALNLPPQNHIMADILHKEDGTEVIPEGDDYLNEDGTVKAKYTLTDKLWAYLQNYAAKHKAAGNGFGYGLVGPMDTCRTLSARYYKDGSEILISQGPGKNPRRLTPRECARLMGFPETYKIPVSDTQAYKQFGNSVVMPVITEVARLMKPFVMELKARQQQTIPELVASSAD